MSTENIAEKRYLKGNMIRSTQTSNKNEKNRNTCLLEAKHERTLKEKKESPALDEAGRMNGG